jgi:hypothetical protein
VLIPDVIIFPWNYDQRWLRLSLKDESASD